MTLTYQIGLPSQHRQRAAALYEEAFRQKLRPAIPDQAQRVAILAESIVADRAVVALADDMLLGLAGFHHSGKSFTSGGSASGVFKQLGLWRGMRAIAFLALLERTPTDGELLMDGIVVAAEARGRGIDTGLLQHLFQFAHKAKPQK